MSRLLILLCCVTLAGCASNGAFPSLSPRPIEKSGVEEVAPAPLPAGVDAGLAQRLTAILEAGEAGHRSFVEEATAARSAVNQASGAATGSEPWITAQTAYSRADSARGVLLSALADIDTVRREQIESPNPTNQIAAAAAAARLEALAREEDATMAELAAKLG
jgi:hypothetical protein